MNAYNDASANLIYQLLFCDNLELFRENITPPVTYPFDILFSEKSTPHDLLKIINDSSTDTRTKILAYNRLIALKQPSSTKQLLGVIVEVGLEGGLDTLAAYVDGTIRYINQSGKVLVWENNDVMSQEILSRLFAESEKIVLKIGPWDQPRRPRPSGGDLRITFLVSDGLYFGEGPMDVLFEDPMASEALNAATQLLQYITDKTMQ